MTTPIPAPDAPLPRRAMLAHLARLAGGALSFAGLTAFGRPATRLGARFAAAPARGGPTPRKWDDRYELAVDVELAEPEGFRYHRPYVAVWVEDAAGQPVRTLTLWVNTTGRGPRYIRELRRWSVGPRDLRRGRARARQLRPHAAGAHPRRRPGRGGPGRERRDHQGACRVPPPCLRQRFTSRRVARLRSSVTRRRATPTTR